jgi:hypothetical protein
MIPPRPLPPGVRYQMKVAERSSLVGLGLAAAMLSGALQLAAHPLWGAALVAVSASLPFVCFAAGLRWVARMAAPAPVRVRVSPYRN